MKNGLFKKLLTVVLTLTMIVSSASAVVMTTTAASNDDEMTTVYSCGYTEHTHDRYCYQAQWVNTCTWNHYHGYGCPGYWTSTLVCTTPEHTHLDSCKKDTYYASFKVVTENASVTYTLNYGPVTAFPADGLKIYTKEYHLEITVTANDGYAINNASCTNSKGQIGFVNQNDITYKAIAEFNNTSDKANNGTRVYTVGTRQHKCSWSNWTQTTAPTCTSLGEDTRSCSRCGKVETRPVDKLDHNYVETIVAPTCTEQGYTHHECACGAFYNDTPVDANGHTWDAGDETPATCTEGGMIIYSCTVEGCGVTSLAPLAPLGHDYQCTGTTASTCTEAGNNHYACSRCTDSNDEPIEKLGHTDAEECYTANALAPTCTEAGHAANTYCGRCNAKLEDGAEIPATGHTVVIDPAVAATCTETGLTAGSHCSACNEVFVAQETVDPLGHTPVVDKAVAPTCTVDGLTEGSHCGRCEEILTAQETVAATGHSLSGWETVKDENGGKHLERHCENERCEYSETSNMEKYTVGVLYLVNGSIQGEKNYERYVDENVDYETLNGDLPTFEGYYFSHWADENGNKLDLSNGLDKDNVNTYGQGLVYAVYYVVPVVDYTQGGGGNGSSLETIEDEDTPLNEGISEDEEDYEEEEDEDDFEDEDEALANLEDEDTPLSENPLTGDAAPVAAAAAAVLSAFGLAVIAFSDKKKN